MAESTQKKLDRIRPPRVNITYDVDLGGAMEQKELPFVMGVLGDFAGASNMDLGRLKDREFIEITPENFDGVMNSMKPRAAFSVDNKISDDPEAGKLNVDLTFESIDDFSPEKVARQVKPIASLLEMRQKLSDLRANLQTNEQLEELLQSTLGDAEKAEKLKSELDAESGSEEDNDG